MAQNRRNGKAAGKQPAKAAQPQAAKMTKLDKTAWYSVLALVFFVPIAMTNFTYLGFQLPFTYDQFDIAKVFVMRAITLVGVAAWAWQYFTSGAKVRAPKTWWLVLAVVAWVALTAATSIHPATAVWGKYRRFEGLVSFINYAVAFFLALQYLDRPSRIRALADALFLSGVLVSFYGLMQVVGIDPIKWGDLPFETNRAFSTYGNPDLLGGYLMFPLPIGLALALAEEEKFKRAMYWLGFLVVVACWITAFVRGAWIGGVFALLAMVVAAWRVGTKLDPVVDLPFAGVTVATGAAIVIRSMSSPHPVTNVVARIQSIFDTGGGSALTRFQIWSAAWAAIKDRPILGFGADTFRLIFPKYKPVEYVAAAGYLSVADNVHNYPLQVGSAMGIPGFGLLYGLFGWTLWLSAPSAFAKGKGRERLVLAGFWAAALGYLVHLFFGLSVTGSTVLLWVAMAALVSPLAATMEWRAPAWGTLAAPVTAALAALLFVGNVVYVTADNHYLAGRVAVGGPVARVASIQRAIELNPYNDMYRAELGLAYQDLFMQWMRQAQSAQQAGQDAAQAKQNAVQSFQSAEKAMKDTIDFVPAEYDNYVFLTNLYGAAGQLLDPAYYEKSIEIGEQGVKVEPYGPAVRYQVAIAYATTGKTDKAIAHLETAAAMDPNYGQVWSFLADLYAKSGQRQRAERFYRDVLAKNPEHEQAKAALTSLESSPAGK